ncbi:MAG: Alanine-tRNA ligase [Candidatus Nomurabacteria bacterium GW2011_GWF2_43_8]|uniref:alanine--tRNA ligase n=3 Tax=Candidatus Nomuraibacteriota TaxID=1752729 RepID=A0A0G1HZL2_9BACT|nr:MAG: Alanine-tRNA ligase [Candidatus Nomurabacteria bacterium GW2011_GWA2_43_15]KKT19028.1 MAG: Alanine-tRNA ligase [Candidatus Nomurabacteria bacterium GW2011_GWB1_43_7]KKT25067.1 MAG: Alanine-tRNA ligase [Candidatus Nomurabacteria bacterium GW2011_GWF2_43_8]
MESNEIRQKFLKFFQNRGHKIIPSSSLIPNDESVLFTTAGMQQFKPYYTNPQAADKDFGGRNVATVQKCIRTGDIDEVGDDTHLTFFEMLGNFSFGGYWKKEAIQYAYDFIVKELGLAIDYVSVFEGDKEIPADNESREIWKKIDSKLTIKNHNRVDNFWGPTGDEGPCGPTTEVYINGVEIWNIVFNEFYKTKDGKYKPLEVKGIDTGMGLERLLVQVQKKNNVYETDLFNGEKIKEERIIADHIKAALFMISDGVMPSNTGAGYVLRRLMRTVASYKNRNIETIVNRYINKYFETYSNLEKEKFLDEFNKEERGYKTSRVATVEILRGRKEKNIVEPLTGYAAFGISSTFGVRSNDISDTTSELNIPVSDNFFQEWEDARRQHQKLSQTSSAGMFKGGLANHNEKTIRLHTAHHLLLAGLKANVDKNIKQRGSNITEERLRMDFLCDHKLTDEEKKKTEDWVNDKIKKGLNVVRREMPLAEAEKIGAEMEFGAKYPEIVSLYFIENEKGETISKEFCGGPHVRNTGELGQFKIQKEEAVAQGIRRIKAMLL